MFGSVRALMMAGLSTLAVGIPSVAPVAPPAPQAAALTAGEDQPLSVMTYNIKGLPWPLVLGREEAFTRIADRLAALRREGRQPHIVLVQEAFVPETARIAARAGYRYVAAGPDAALRTSLAAESGDVAYLNRAYWHRGEQAGKPVSSGLLILSDYPITGTARLAFPDFACAGFDCLANKGVLVADLAVPGVGTVSVVNTHLNARRSAGVPIERSQRAFDRQAALLADFVRASVPDGRPLVVGGDVNIGRDADRHRVFFAHFARVGLGFVAPSHGAVRRALKQRVWGDPGARRDLVHADEHGADWVFARDSHNTPLSVASGRVPFGEEVAGEPLSDHYGYEIDYALPAMPAQTT